MDSYMTDYLWTHNHPPSQPEAFKALQDHLRAKEALKRSRQRSISKFEIKPGHAYRLRGWHPDVQHAKIFAVGLDFEGKEKAFGVTVAFRDGREELDSADWHMNGSFTDTPELSRFDIVEELGILTRKELVGE